MSRKTFSFLGLSLLCISGAATAQLSEVPGNSRPSDGTFADRFNSEALIGDPMLASEAYVIGSTIGRCVVNIAGENAGKLLGGPNTTDERYRALTRGLTRRYSACSHGNVPPMIVNYGVAEALVKKESRQDLTDRAMSVDVDEAQAFQGAADVVTMDAIARCLAVYSPGLVQKVVESNLNSPDQESALQSVYAKTPECGVGEPPSSIPSVLQRGALAVALYQWSHRG